MTANLSPYSRYAATFVLAVGVRDCVATANPNLRRDKTLEDQSPQPRSGGICVSRGREPAVKWKIRLSRGAAALAATQSRQPAVKVGRCSSRGAAALPITQTPGKTNRQGTPE